MVENQEYFKMLARMIRAAGRRVEKGGNGEDLLHLRRLRVEIDNAMAEAVSGLGRQGYSLGYIATCLGVSRQHVHQKWGKPRQDPLNPSRKSSGIIQPPLPFPEGQ